MKESFKNKDNNKDSSREKSNANLNPIKPGEVRNPAGRPKKALCIPDILRELAALPSKYDADKKKTRLRAICDRALDQAEGGDKDARNWIADRMEGKAIDRIISRDADAEMTIE